MARRLILDVYCGAGGASRGYYEAGFAVIGVDINPQPNYPHPFIQMDALRFLAMIGNGTMNLHPEAVHASPPCQARTPLQKQNKLPYPELVPPTRLLLEKLGLPYVIENVPGETRDPEAQLINPITLCGTMFPGLRVIRHRLFETNWPLVAPPEHPKHPLVFTHDKRKLHHGKLDQDTSFVQVTGGGNCTVANARDAMGIDWMEKGELNEAIPPAYTEYVGTQLQTYLTLKDR